VSGQGVFHSRHRGADVADGIADITESVVFRDVIAAPHWWAPGTSLSSATTARVSSMGHHSATGVESAHEPLSDGNSFRLSVLSLTFRELVRRHGVSRTLLDTITTGWIVP